MKKCVKNKKLRIEKQIKLGDAAMIEGDYYNAAVFYERAASYGNNYGMHSSMNDTLSKLKKPMYILEKLRIVLRLGMKFLTVKLI